VETTIQDVGTAIEYSLDILSHLEAETWLIPQSGGKDSRATAQVALALIEDGRLAPPQRMVFYLADTLLEFERFIVQARWALGDLVAKAKSLGIEAHSFVTVPIPQDGFWVRIIGYGFVPPTARMRSCTDKLKISPPRKILKRRGWDKAPLLLGVRLGESQRRDKILSCSTGGECGPDRLYLKLKQRASSAQRAIAPIRAWRTCAVWDFLTLIAPRYGFDNDELVELYGPGGDLRYGCWCCPLIYEDRAGEYLAQEDPKVGELVRFTDSILRPGGAAWQTQNRELCLSANGSGELSDGRLSLDFCRQLFAWMLDFEARWSYPLLPAWQKQMIQAVWAWRESLTGVQAGIQGQLSLKF
jgi:DNA sulfur modification protein DndC